MNWLTGLLGFLQWIVLAYLGIASIYFFLYSFAGILYKRKWPLLKSVVRRFAVFIPAYKEDEVIVHSVKNSLAQEYPRDKYDIIVIADQLGPATIKKLRELPVIVFEVELPDSSKALSLNEAMNQLPYDQYDIALVLDADNIMIHDFLYRVNDLFNRGALAVQGHRIAKNDQTSLAILDGISEEINNHIYRKGHYCIGLSSALIGSGMGIRYDLFKKFMGSINSYAEDKELEFHLMYNGIRIHYEENAFLYDEKTSHNKAFVRQRSRWIMNQLAYVSKYFMPSLKQLIHNGNIDLFDKFFQQLLPPRVIYLGAISLFAMFTWFMNPLWLSITWSAFFMMTMLTFLFSVPKRYYNIKTLKALALVPGACLLMIKSFLSINKAKKGFGATTHKINNLNESVSRHVDSNKSPEKVRRGA